MFAATLILFGVGGRNASGEETRVTEPEKAARAAAAKYEKRKGFRLRQDFWSGVLSGVKGKAIRLQFFKGNKYRLFLAAAEAEKKAKTKLHVMVIDRAGNVIAESRGGDNVATVEVKPPKTGAYMILMRAELPDKSSNRNIPTVLFYGYE